VDILIFLLLWSAGFLLLWRIPVPEGGATAAERPPVSLIVPARNEAGNLPALFDALAAQDLQPLEVLVVDDQSTDGTAAVARARGARVIACTSLPEGWLGKPWACWQGAEAARGEILVFLDADTRLEPGGLARLLNTWAGQGGLLTVQPYHRMVKGYEQLAAFFNLVAMAGLGVFGALPRDRASAAAFGPCSVCRRADYFAADGHRAARGAVVESLALARAFAGAGFPVRCRGGRGTLAFRMYPEGWRSLVEGFGKGFALGAESLPPHRLALIGGWITGGFGALRHGLVALAAGDGLALLAWGACYLLYAGQTFWLLRRIGNFHPLTALAYPVPLLFFLGVFLHSLANTFGRRRVQWKGRSIETS
jgi:4,4'-diaponeurosporenoate glycosyltransferase